MRFTGAATLRGPLTLCETSFPKVYRPTSRTSLLWSCTVALLCRQSPWLIRQISSRVSHVCDSFESSTSSAFTDRPVSRTSGAFPACSWQFLASLRHRTHNALVLPPASSAHAADSSRTFHPGSAVRRDTRLVPSHLPCCTLLWCAVSFIFPRTNALIWLGECFSPSAVKHASLLGSLMISSLFVQCNALPCHATSSEPAVFGTR